MILLLLGLLAFEARVAVPDPEIVLSIDPAGVAEVSDQTAERIRTTAAGIAADVRALLPELDERIEVRVTTIDRDLTPVGGVAGWADAPGVVQLLISVTYPGGIDAAVDEGLPTVLYHEFHHLWRGWTLNENRFGPGIPTAVVNEGLAAVFADTHGGVAFERFDYPANVEEWLAEILELPLDADYDTWMNDHPDGRIAVGYRTGRYVVHQAMARSGLSIVELSARSPERILELAGYD
jgi:hypothetical protein